MSYDSSSCSTLAVCDVPNCEWTALFVVGNYRKAAANALNEHRQSAHIDIYGERARKTEGVRPPKSKAQTRASIRKNQVIF